MEVLERALALLDDGRSWHQGRYAADAFGCPVPTASPDAEKFCMVGALYRAATDMEATDKYVDGLRLLQAQTEHPNLAIWNDARGRTWGQVNEVFRRAIAETPVEALA